MKAEKPGERRPRSDRPHRDTYTAFDRKMISCKERNEVVAFTMSSGSVHYAIVCSVDKYFIEVELSVEDGGKKPWLNKAQIVDATPNPIIPADGADDDV